MTETRTAEERMEIARTIAAQIGRGNLMAISGSRVIATETGVILPVGSGYRVEVDYRYGSDDYAVRRVFTRAGKTWTRGEVERVYCEDLGSLAYYASCFRSYDETEWMVQS